MKNNINSIKRTAICALIYLVATSGCSTQKDAWPNRAYHQLNTKYNGLFYAEQYLNEGIKKIENSHKDDYKKILELNKYGDTKAAQSAQSSLDQAIEKSQLAIQKHSMEINGSEKNKLVDRGYMVIGKAQFYKKDYTQAINTLGFLVRKSSKPEIQTEALLWLTRCYQEQNNEEAIRKNIIQLEEDFYLDRNQDAALDEIQAKIAIQEKYYAEAISHLEKVLKKTKTKNKKIRTHYVLGQLNLLLVEPNLQGALKHFNQVIKKNPTYELAFNAKLMRTKTYKPDSLLGQKQSHYNFLKSSLEHMIKDDKNIEYKDQIYFALGNLALQNLDTLSGVSYLKMSNKHSSYNMSQKMDSHWLLARLFWEQKNYTEAYHESDSAHQLSTPLNPEHNKIKKMRRNAKKVAIQQSIISKNDSIIDLARLPEKQRNDIIDQHITQLRKAEQEEKMTNERPSSNFNSYEFNRQSQNSMSISSGGGWYFYNPSAISLGYSEFLSRWGNRQLEDNWRRKNKNQIIVEGEEEELTTEGGPTEKQKYDRDYYVDQLPLTEEEQLGLLDKIETAYYDLGRIFKEDLEDYSEAILTYHELIDRFPLTDYRQLVYFDLYNTHSLRGDSLNAKTILNKIQKEHPKSTYLRIIQGDTTLVGETKEYNTKYNVAYNLYATFSQESCEELRELLDSNPNNPNIAQIELMNEFCQAQKSDKKTFIERLQKIETKYPGTVVSNKIDTIVQILKGELNQDPTKKYVNEFASEHYFFITIKDLTINLPEIQSSISKFNKQNYRLDSLEITNLLLSKEAQILRVSSFKNKEKALAYYELIQESPHTKSQIKNPQVQPFIISRNNYKVLLKDKDIADYLGYFNKIYLLN